MTGLARPVRIVDLSAPIKPSPPGTLAFQRTQIEYLNHASGASEINRGVRNVVDATITVYLPDAATSTGAGAIIAPGGGFGFLQWNSEGTHVAEYLQKHGVASLVLRDRLTDTGTDEAIARMNARARGTIPPDSPQPPSGAPYGGGPNAIAKVQAVTGLGRGRAISR